MQTQYAFPQPLAVIIIDYALPSCEMKVFNYIMKGFKSECDKLYRLDEFGYDSFKYMMSSSKMIPVRYIADHIDQETKICDIVYHGHNKLRDAYIRALK